MNQTNANPRIVPVMVKDEPGGSASAASNATAVEKHFAMHGIYSLPTSAGSMAASPSPQRPIKQFSREDAMSDDQDFLSTSHCKYRSKSFSKSSAILMTNWYFDYSMA